MTNKTVGLLCGKEREFIQLPEDVLTLEMGQLNPLPYPVEALEGALRSPLGTDSLAALARGKRDACVVISDVTRPVPNRVILPPLLATLTDAGIPQEKITILIATGMHRPNLGDELAEMVGREVMDNYRIINHDCHDGAVCRQVMVIDGAPIELNSHYLDADLKILTGLVEPHFYAGFSGGRKSLLPGIASFNTMKFMHSYQMIAHPRVTNCRLEGNPFHEHGLQVAAAVGVDFIVNAVLTRDRQPAIFYTGDYHLAHQAACDLVYSGAVVRLEHPADLVITSGGGYPLDASFYQVSKGLIGARDILRPGGTVIITCGCQEGLGGPEFRKILGEGLGPAQFFLKYCKADNFVIDQWCAQNIYQVLEHAGKVYLHSPNLVADELERIGIEKVTDLQAKVDELLPKNPRTVVIPDGPYVVGMVANPD